MHNHRTYAKMVRENQNREEKLHSLENELAELRKAKVISGEAAELTEKRKLLTEAHKKQNVSSYPHFLLNFNTKGLTGLKMPSVST